ncbi:CobW C-terminal domain-containing protein [Skeletonema marinoi]|uniref:CobW C-terminal domain-containing protein n=1 Tax=Skeletonema marinoi TaxID=267567 RepID=A0AAD8YI46_9STRA|nr:CobW C-terminal domain-containing protein [Skeletonema marinoi]
MADSKENDLTPITVITGFLGAGKTTLVNYILKEQNQWKICVLENEFGEVAIDDGLVAESLDAPEDLITMDNGCVCCSVRGDLVRTLGQLATRRKDFDAILLETTGLADPAPIVYTVQTNPKMSDNYRIDSIVCLAIWIWSLRGKGKLEARLRTINKFATVIETEKSRAPLDRILGLNSFNMESILTYDPNFFDDEDEKKIHNLEERAADLYRTKGLLSFHGQGDTKFVFQGVHEQINFGPAQKPWKEGEVRENKFVFIGKNLDRAELTKSLMECLYKEGKK